MDNSMKEYGVYSAGTTYLWELLYEERAWCYLEFKDLIKKMEELGIFDD
jgi:hypothetical protein